MYTKSDILNYLSDNRGSLFKNFHLTKIGLFGSYARNEQTEDSDIDLIVEFEDGTKNLFDLKLELKEYIRKNLNLDVDICREKFIHPH